MKMKKKMYIVCKNNNCRELHPLSDYATKDIGAKCKTCGGVIIGENGEIELSGVDYVFQTVDTDKLGEYENKF